MERVEPSAVQTLRSAQDVLKRYYQMLKEVNGKGPTASEFYPLKVENIVRLILEWEVEGVAEIGTVGVCERVQGRCDYKGRKIFIAVDAQFNPGMRSFTVAHEIGHAVLHGNTGRSEGGFLNRTPSVRPRAFKERESDSGLRMEREANRFAVALLMPERAVRDRFKKTFGSESLWIGSEKLCVRPRSLGQPTLNIVEASYYVVKLHPTEKDEPDTRNLVDFFGVSVDAMARRLRELGLIYSGGIVNQ